MKLISFNLNGPVLPPTLRSSNKSTRIEDVFPIQDGDFPASYVCLPEGNNLHINPWPLYTLADLIFFAALEDVFKIPL